MTNSFTQAHWEELVRLRRENLALRLEVAQLRDILKQQDAALRNLTGAAEEFICAAMPATPHPTPSGASQGQPVVGAGDGGPPWEIANVDKRLTHRPGIVEITHSYSAPSLESQRKAIAELMEIYSTERTLPIVGYADFD